MTMTDDSIRAQYETYRTALDGADLPAAIEAAVQIEETERNVNSLLEQFTEALENGETQLARTVLGQIADTYERRKEDIQADVQKAVVTIEEEELSGQERDELLSFTRQASEAELSRAGFLLEAASFFEGDGSESSVIETTQTVTSSEEQIETAAESVSSTTSGRELSASPTLLGSQVQETLTRGTSVPLTVTVGNVGDASTDTLTLAASGGEGLEIEAPTLDLGTVAGGGRKESDVTVTGVDPGTHEVTVVLRSGDDEVESLTASVTVKESPDSIREAVIGEETPDPVDIQQSISYWANNEPIPGTGGETLDTETLQAFVTEWVRAGGESDE